MLGRLVLLDLVTLSLFLARAVMHPRHDREPPMQSRIDAADKLRARKRAARSRRAKMFGAGIAGPNFHNITAGWTGRYLFPSKMKP